MKIIYSLFICVSLIGCKKTEHIETIEIDIEEGMNEDRPKLSIGSIIQLESNDSTYFGDINSMAYHSDRFHLLDIYTSKSLWTFSTKDGSFINRTKVGRGPGELIGPFAFYVDQDENTIYVYDQILKSFYKLDQDLNYLASESFDGTPLVDFVKLDQGKLLARTSYYKEFAYDLYFPGFVLEKQFISEYKYDGSQGLFKAIDKQDDKVLMISAFDYNIYEFAKSDVKSKYYLDVGKNKLLKEDIEKGLSHVWELLRSGRRVSSPMSVSSNEEFVFFSVYHLNGIMYFLYDSKTKAKYNLNDYIKSGALPKCKYIGTLGRGRFYAVVEPADMLQFQKMYKKGDIMEINTSNNPLLITFDLSI